MDLIFSTHLINIMIISKKLLCHLCQKMGEGSVLGGHFLAVSQFTCFRLSLSFLCHSFMTCDLIKLYYMSYFCFYFLKVYVIFGLILNSIRPIMIQMHWILNKFSKLKLILVLAKCVRPAEQIKVGHYFW